MEYGKETLFSYYIDIYGIPNIHEWDSYEELPYLKTCCGQTIMKKSFFSKYNEMNYYGHKLWNRLKERLDPPIRHPLLDTVQYKMEYSPYEFLTRKEEWQEESLGVLNNAPRTYLDMVVSRPGLNVRILLKIIDGYKCNIFYDSLTIDRRRKSNRTSISGFESHSYKKLFEYYDGDNTKTFASTLHKDGFNLEDETYQKYDSLGQSIWYHKSIVKTFNEELENTVYNGLGVVDYDSLKHCINVENVNIADIQSGKVVSEQLSAELEEKVQFALIVSWLLISEVFHPRYDDIPFKHR